KISYEMGRGDAYNNIGVLHYRRGEYIEATKAHFQALAIREKIGDREGQALSHINLGNIYSDQNNNQLALDHYLAAANMLNEINDKNRLPIIYLNISAVFLSENKFDEGLPYCEKARLAAIEIHDSTILAEALNNLGVVKESQNSFQDALDFYSQAMKISEATNDKTEMVDNMTNIGNMNRMLKNYDLALEWHAKTEKLAREISYLEGLRVLYNDFSKDYQAMGKFEQALNYQVHFKQLSDSLFNDENTSRINDLSDKWEKDRNEKDLLRQQGELDHQKENERMDEQRLWVIGIGGFILLLFTAYVFYSNSRMKRANLLIKAQAEEIARKKKSEIA
ncbi:MAG TPA: tetratricopeptide repeat protein, partial [Bacteroidia bacterium]|nr:tetratricopeptide repeat protein [Bacteroidia bacterium]